MFTRRSMFQAAALTGAAATPLAACAKAPAKRAERRDVRDFGAVGDGRTDDTAAFNRVCAAAAPWSEALFHSIHVPAGTWRIDGTVHLRNGQDLSGEGFSTIIDASKARGETFVTGTREDGSADTAGPPVTLTNLRTLGGDGRRPLIAVRTHGFLLRDLFLSAAGTAIAVEANDGLIANVEVDQALNGVVMRDCQNITIGNLIVYSANQGIVLGRNARTIAIGASTICYSKFASLLVEEGATGVQDVRLNGCHFVTNVQPDGFLGHVHLRGRAPQLDFTGCSFRNWPGAAIRHGAGDEADLSFTACTFDARRPTADFNISSTAAGIATGPGMRARFAACTFRALHGPVAAVGPGLAALSFDGGSVEECTGAMLARGRADAVAVSVRDVAGFGERRGGAILLPLTGAATVWKLAVTGRTPAGGFSAELLCEAGPNGCRVRPLWTAPEQGAPAFRCALADDRLAISAAGGAIDRWRVSSAA